MYRSESTLKTCAVDTHAALGNNPQGWQEALLRMGRVVEVYRTGTTRNRCYQRP